MGGVYILPWGRQRVADILFRWTAKVSLNSHFTQVACYCLVLIFPRSTEHFSISIIYLHSILSNACILFHLMYYNVLINIPQADT